MLKLCYKVAIAPHADGWMLHASAGCLARLLTCSLFCICPLIGGLLHMQLPLCHGKSENYPIGQPYVPNKETFRSLSYFIEYQIPGLVPYR